MWRAEFINADNCRLYRGEAIAAHVVRDADGWWVRPNIAGRRGSRKAYVGCAVAAMTYFSHYAKDVQAAIVAAHDRKTN